MDSKIFKPSCPTCVCVAVFHTSMSIIYIYIYLYMHIDIYGYRFLVAVRFCVRFYTCFSLHSAAIFSATHDACQTLCAVRKKRHPEPNSVLDWNRGTLMRGEDGRHSISPFESKCSEKMTFRAATNFGSSATSPVKVNKGGRGNVLVLGLPGEGRPWNPTSSSKFLVRVRSNTTAGGKDFMVFRRA